MAAKACRRMFHDLCCALGCTIVFVADPLTILLDTIVSDRFQLYSVVVAESSEGRFRVRASTRFCELML
ncbi:hypothetical protein P171DRAFT_435894 [Karstenula rhodostoma CBS 690.94]|uniref:Uncharacterized protein n=1 Tax=Karstenula rhodostoma CBS 690.94 TaxID=1392251 RepID=A0A9P4PA53_9PLEO|nr:hypothetical protein P171DRAFT_435894 [Karstenula rhodostoma CBS 690.94]